MNEEAIAFVPVEAYLAMDAPEGVRLEYVDGAVYAKQGAQPEHCQLESNLHAALLFALRERGQPCRVYSSNLRVAYASRLYLYPDLTVICGELERDLLDPMTVTNPRLVIEILSPTTERYDRGLKLARYMQIESLGDYLLVSQDTPRVELFHRGGPAGEGFDAHYQAVVGIDTSIVLPTLDITLALADIYRDYAFPTAPPGTDYHQGQSGPDGTG